MNTLTWSVRGGDLTRGSDLLLGRQLLVDLGLSDDARGPDPEDLERQLNWFRREGIEAVERLREKIAIAVTGDNEVVGAAKYFPHLSYIHTALKLGMVEVANTLVYRPVLSQLGVLPQARGQGIGAELVRSVVASCQRSGCDVVWALAEGVPGPELERLVGLYKSVGFSAVGEGVRLVPRRIFGEMSEAVDASPQPRLGRYVWRVLS